MIDVREQYQFEIGRTSAVCGKQREHNVILRKRCRAGFPEEITGKKNGISIMKVGTEMKKHTNLAT